MTSWTLLTCLVLVGVSSRAQDQPPAGEAGQDDPAPEMIRLTFPDDTTLKVLADYVAQRLELNLIYDGTQLSTRKLTIRSSVEIPKQSLLDLLSGALRAHDLALAKTQVPGTLRIVSAKQLIAVPNRLGQADLTDADSGAQLPIAGGVVSRVFSFEHITASRAQELISEFITKPGATSQLIAEQDLLIVNDYASNMPKLAEIIALADRPPKSVGFATVAVTNFGAEQLAGRVSAVLDARAKAQGLEPSTNRVSIVAAPGANDLVVFAPPDELTQIAALIKSLDVSPTLKTQVYRLRVAEADRVDEVIASVLGESTADRLYRSVSDEQTNELVVTTTPAIHDRIAEIVADLDQAPSAEESPVRFYKLKNADATELIKTLTGILGMEGEVNETGRGASAGDNRFGSAGSGGFDPAGLADFDTSRRLDERARATPRSVNDASRRSPATSTSNATNQVSAELADARVIADVSTNTIIVVARPSVQPIYEQLINQLDVRLPQVLLQATIVAIDTTDDFRLGFEYSNVGGTDGGTILNFTQFGLSTADPVTGALTPNLATGFNGALLDADIAEVVLQALQRDVNSAILTSPQILVNDNEQGVLSREQEEPIETNVLTGAGASQATFGGYATAGTRIDVTPSISEGDYLKLKYDIILSDFIGDPRAGSLPPSRESSQLTSTATIPDGHTIIVGGLTREVDQETIQSVPILGEIPVLKYAFSSRSTTKRQVTLFIFLKPTILRDDKFEDLKVLSGAAAGRANLPSDFPASMPVEIR